jgi:hypothetical protein
MWLFKNILFVFNWGAEGTALKYDNRMSYKEIFEWNTEKSSGCKIRGEILQLYLIVSTIKFSAI